MKVALEALDHVQAHSNTVNEKNSQHASDLRPITERSGYTLSLSGGITDQNVYSNHGRDKSHGRTLDDIMQEAGNEDIVSQRNYMTIMSNTMSQEDFARLQEEGTYPGDLEVGTVVTIIDHIKAALVQGGTEVAGYTSDLDAEQFEKITGNKVLAQELARQFREKDLPVTEENIKATGLAWEKAQDLAPLSEGATKYMVENKLSPTIENLYLAQHSGGSDAGKQGRGYYSQELKSGHTGYYAKKADQYHWESLESQIETVVREAGYESNEETLSDGKWLIEKGIPLTSDNFEALHRLRELHLPQSEAETAQAIAAAIADASNPLAADLLDPSSNFEKAAAYVKAVSTIEPQAVDFVLSRRQRVTLGTLVEAGNNTAASDRFGSDASAGVSGTEESIIAKRQLEEIRLKMTIEVNMKLLRRGFHIETASLEQLVEQLRKTEKEIQMQLTGTRDGAEAARGFSLYRETVAKVNGIATMPAALIGKIAMTDGADIATLNRVHESGTVLHHAYVRAGETYETVMTAPRRDMGDSIRKAFQNVDAILEDLNLHVSERNRRAVRILGYNSMELSEENIAAVREKDSLLQDVISKCKPGAVLKMIRDKVNPLTMRLEDLQNYLSNGSRQAIHFTDEQTFRGAVGEIEDYSRFLYKLERRNGISEQERKAYIGVYRLLRQIEKGDSAVVGAMVNAEMEFSMSNLLTAVRSSKKQGTDVLIDDGFGGVRAAASQDDLKEIMKEIVDSLDTQEAKEDFYQDEIKDVRNLRNVENDVIKSLLDHRQPVTWNHLMAAGNRIKYPGKLFRETMEYAKETGKEEQLRDRIKELQEDFTSAESAEEAYYQLEKTMAGIYTDASEMDEIKAIDLKELGRMYRQIHFTASLAKEEQYDVPVEIDGELTAINLRIIHNPEEGGRVCAGISTEATGRAVCELTVSEGVLGGYVTCQKKEGLERLKQSDDILKEMLDNSLKETNIQIGNIHFIQSDKPDGYQAIHEEGIANRPESQRPVSTEELYMAAKAFIGYLQKAI